ncbi:SDR family NAD(P)-dependent oxidoreductase [Roseovarius sp. B08]|uniref:SDR family NAD(P)-dependent oxidoreductase n=1 Tax=Roseovarius sp. B08 TaxID=3449223 RepID=UPI003EDC6113
MTQRTAIITGGLAGIGLATARLLHQAGHTIAIGARRGDDTSLQDMARDTVGADVFVAPLDVRQRGSVAAFCASVKNQFGTPQILVNGAGVTRHQTVSDHDLDAWDDVIETNLTGTFLMIHACLPDMMASGWGRIVNIASTAATSAVADHPAYCASKSGVLGLSRAVALEGAPHGVTCTTVSPTWVETEMLRSSAATIASQNGTTQAEEIAALARANPQNRLVQPDEVAAIIAFLCSDAAPGLTMEDIQINAGAHW